MQSKVFIATGVLAVGGGLATAALSSSCDTVCTTEAQPSATIRIVTEDGSALAPADVDLVWYRVYDEPAPRSDDVAPPPEEPGPWITNPDSEWQIAECEDEACTRWVLGHEEPGYYEIRAKVCGDILTARTFVQMTDDGCHVDTEELELLVDSEACADDDGPHIKVPDACTTEARPSMVLELVDPAKGTPYIVTADRVYATVDGSTRAINGDCMNEDCSIWSLGREQEGIFTVHADVCGVTSDMNVRVGMTSDGCHVDTVYDLMEVDSSDCPKPFTTPAQDFGPQCDLMARPSAMIFVVETFGDHWVPAQVDSVWYEYEKSRHKAFQPDDAHEPGTWVTGWEQPGRYKVHTELCGKQFTTSFNVPMTADGCHVDTQYVPLLVDKTGCFGQP
jgi:hypothetical protein